MHLILKGTSLRKKYISIAKRCTSCFILHCKGTYYNIALHYLRIYHIITLLKDISDNAYFAYCTFFLQRASKRLHCPGGQKKSHIFVRFSLICRQYANVIWSPISTMQSTATRLETAIPRTSNSSLEITVL